MATISMQVLPPKYFSAVASFPYTHRGSDKNLTFKHILSIFVIGIEISVLVKPDFKKRCSERKNRYEHYYTSLFQLYS